MADKNMLLGRNLIRDPFFKSDTAWEWVNTSIKDPVPFSDMGVVSSGRSVILEDGVNGNVLKPSSSCCSELISDHIYYSGVSVMYKISENSRVPLFNVGAKFTSVNTVDDTNMSKVKDLNRWGVLSSYGIFGEQSTFPFRVTRSAAASSIKGSVHVGFAFLIDLTDIFGDDTPDEVWCKENINLQTLYGLDQIEWDLPRSSDSILLTIKKLLGDDEYYEVFHTDIITAINTSFMVLNQIGVGPKRPFSISGVDEKWTDFMGDAISDFEGVKSYIYLRSKLLFDPPNSGVLHEAMERQTKEYEWRLLVAAEQYESGGESQNGT